MRTITLAILLLSSACQREQAKTPPAPTPSPAKPEPAPAKAEPEPTPPAPTPPAPTPTEPAAAATRVEDLDGLKVEFFADGRVAVRGKDQWGGAIDTTYETTDYFQKAIPTLSRTVTPAQAEKLGKLATPAAAPAPGAAHGSDGSAPRKPER